MKGLAKLEPGPGHLDIAERPEPVAGGDQVVIDVLGVGICGTDLHIAAGEYATVAPVTIGHEVCGVVRELGAGVDPAWRDARVVIETYASTCERCRMCRSGHRNMCPQRRSFGTHVNGGAAPRMTVPTRNLHRVPPSLSDPAATLAEPLACVCHSLLDPQVISAGDDALVVGPGAMGLLAAQVARVCGANVVIRGTRCDDRRLALAGELGFEVEMAEDAVVEPDIGGDGRFDVAIECSGSGAGVTDALATLRRRGTLVQIGLRGADLTVPWDLICFRELRVHSGFASTPRSWLRAMTLLSDESVACEPLITAVMPLTAWEQAFDSSRDRRGVKYVLDPRAV
jgi:L-iditol 2-dehydrogenase